MFNRRCFRTASCLRLTNSKRGCLELNVDNSDELPSDIEDIGYEDDDLEDDGLTFIG